MSITMPSRVTTLLLCASAVPVLGFQILQTPVPRMASLCASEFKEPGIAELPNIVPDIAPMDLVQQEDDDVEFEIESVTKEPPLPLSKVEPAGRTDSEAQGTEVEIDVPAQASHQAKMIGRLLGMDTGAFPNNPVSGSEAKAIPGMRKVPAIKNYQTDKVIKSFRKVGDQYPEIVKPTDLTKPETHTP